MKYVKRNQICVHRKYKDICSDSQYCMIFKKDLFIVLFILTAWVFIGGMQALFSDCGENWKAPALEVRF